MNRDRAQFPKAGASLFLIGQGTPGNAAAFRRELGLDIDLLVDTDRRAYKAAGTKVATLGELVAPKMVLRGLRRSRESKVFQGKIVGHPAQLGGLMLVTPGSDVPWAHLSDDASDYPPNDEVLEAIRSALARAESRPAA
ncbi:MAG: AhpC/TSA family protein [Actinobacteria bacterium]|nr:AhpC/TSA family protein [Actinomycetota bacterium]